VSVNVIFHVRGLPIKRRGSGYRRQIKAFEFQLNQSKRRAASPQTPFVRQQIDTFQRERAVWESEKSRLQEEHEELRETNEELQAMVEYLKGQISGQGLISAPRSPVISPSLSQVHHT